MHKVEVGCGLWIGRRDDLAFGPIGLLPANWRARSSKVGATPKPLLSSAVPCSHSDNRLSAAHVSPPSRANSPSCCPDGHASQVGGRAVSPQSAYHPRRLMRSRVKCTATPPLTAPAGGDDGWGNSPTLPPMEAGAPGQPQTSLTRKRGANRWRERTLCVPPGPPARSPDASVRTATAGIARPGASPTRRPREPGTRRESLSPESCDLRPS
jgi:hypothetical protein